MATDILIYGSQGQLGWELLRQCEKAGMDYAGLDLPDSDVSDYDQVRDAFYQNQPKLVINASAYTAVDQAEEDRATAYRVNADGPENLAQCCLEAKVPLIHVSTDYVFDGQSDVPYTEESSVSPLGVYGKSKEAGERKIRSLHSEHIIIRTSWVYGVHGSNFVKTMLRLGQERDQISVVNDQFGCPTFAGDLAEAILMIVGDVREHKRRWGTYHYCGAGVISWFDFADYIIRYAGQYLPMKIATLSPISTSEYPTKAERPQYSALNCDKIGTAFNVIPRPWNQSLERMLQEYLGNV